ncbi:MAG: hypothetical protein PHT03_05710 [Bacilli bacterium]|nr:hypothetical protein [Bacilli bacterium]MDD4389013.1 hypothetical protein [Bacilli bacterium]
MNKQNQKRELTYNEARALLEEMYARGDTEFAKEFWTNKPNEETAEKATETEEPKQ